MLTSYTIYRPGRDPEVGTVTYWCASYRRRRMPGEY